MNPGETTTLRLFVAALMSWDLGAREPLAEAMRKYPIPAEMLPILADIVSGKRKPKPHVAGLKIPAHQVGECAEFVSGWLVEQDVYTRPHPRSGALEQVPDRRTMEGPEPHLKPQHWPPLVEHNDLEHTDRDRLRPGRRQIYRKRAQETLAGLAAVWGVTPIRLKRLARDFDRLLLEIQSPR